MTDVSAPSKDISIELLTAAMFPMTDELRELIRNAAHEITRLRQFRDWADPQIVQHGADELEIERLGAENRIMRGLLAIGPDADQLITDRIARELAAETGLNDGRAPTRQVRCAKHGTYEILVSDPEIGNCPVCQMPMVAA